MKLFNPAAVLLLISTIVSQRVDAGASQAPKSAKSAKSNKEEPAPTLRALTPKETTASKETRALKSKNTTAAKSNKSPKATTPPDGRALKSKKTKSKSSMPASHP